MEARQHKPTGGLMGEEIVAFATKEEWREVIDRLLRGFGEPEGAPAELIYWLINQRVYE